MPDLTAYLTSTRDQKVMKRANGLIAYLKPLWQKRFRTDDDGIGEFRADESEDFVSSGSSLGTMFRFAVENAHERPLGIRAFFSLIKDAPHWVMSENATRLFNLVMSYRYASE